MAPCPQPLRVKCVGAAVPGRGAAGRAGAGPENSPQPRSVGQSARGATPALPHGSALAARGGTPGQRLGDRNGAAGRGGGGASS